MTDEVTLISLADRVSVIEQRLGIDPAAVLAEQVASNAAGADAHAANPQSDVAPPAVPESAESALELAIEHVDAGDHQAALDVLNTALQSWPDDTTLQKAQADVAKTVTAAAAAEQSAS